MRHSLLAVLVVAAACSGGGGSGTPALPPLSAATDLTGLYFEQRLAVTVSPLCPPEFFPGMIVSEVVEVDHNPATGQIVFIRGMGPPEVGSVVNGRAEAGLTVADVNAARVVQFFVSSDGLLAYQGSRFINEAMPSCTVTQEVGGTEIVGPAPAQGSLDSAEGHTEFHVVVGYSPAEAAK